MWVAFANICCHNRHDCHDLQGVRMKVNRVRERLRHKRTIIHACFANAVTWESPNAEVGTLCETRVATGSYG